MTDRPGASKMSGKASEGPLPLAREGPMALIAGEGSLPVALARRLAKGGTPPLILALRSDLEALAPYAGRLVRLRAPKR